MEFYAHNLFEAITDLVNGFKRLGTLKSTFILEFPDVCNNTLLIRKLSKYHRLSFYDYYTAYNYSYNENSYIGVSDSSNRPIIIKPTETINNVIMSSHMNFNSGHGELIRQNILNDPASFYENVFCKNYGRKNLTEKRILENTVFSLDLRSLSNYIFAIKKILALKL